MFGKSGVKKEFEVQFCLDPGKLAKLVDILRDHAQKIEGTAATISFRVETEDNLYYETMNIDDVLGDDNMAGHSIANVIVSLNSVSDQGPIVQVAFSRVKDPHVSFSIRAPSRDWCLVVAEDMETQLKRTFIGKSTWLSDPRIDSMVGLLLLVVFTAAAAAFILHGESVSALDGMTVDDKLDFLVASRVDRGPLWAIGFLIAAMPVLMVMTWWRPLARIARTFRRSVFYWGDMAAWHDRLSRRDYQLKWAVLVGLAVAIVSGVIVSILLAS